MITLYPPGCTDFSTNGLGILAPSSCNISKTAAGMWEMTIEHPIDNTLRWAQITNGCVIKAPTPVRESPLYEIEAFEGSSQQTTTVTRSIYKVKTNGSRLHLRKSPSMSAKIVGSYAPGTQVVRLGSSGSWMKVSIRKGGATGYMFSSNLQKVGDITETVSQSKPLTRVGVQVQPSRDQLFRVNSVEVDTANASVTVKCNHVFYDLRGNIINGKYDPDKVPANNAVSYIAAHLLNSTEHSFYAPNLTEKISGSYGYKSPVEALLDPDEGIVKLSGAMLVRDNFDVYLLPDIERDMGVTVRRGKNLTGVVVTTDASDVVTRIVPVGKAKNGDDLFLSGTIYVDSAHINDYPSPMTQRKDYDVKIIDKNPDNETTFTNVTAARNKLAALARADFESGVDLPSYQMTVNFEMLEYAEGYEDYAALQSIHLYDTVTVIDEMIGLRAKVRVSAYEWDALSCQYTSITLGDIQDVQQTVYSYNLPDGGVSGTKIVNNSLPGTALRNLSVDYAKISALAVQQLTVNALTATQANIQSLAAGRITTDELYVSLAQLAAAEVGEADIEHADVQALAVAVAAIAEAQIEHADIETAVIQDAQVQALAAALARITRADIETAALENALIDWAGIDNLTAQAAAIAKANVGTAAISSANVGWAAIQEISAQLAEIAQARIDGATITQAQIDALHAEVVDTLTLTAQNANFDFASAQRLVASAMILDQGVGGSVTIENLAATSAMFVQATLGGLTLKGDDGGYYDVTVTADGALHTQRVEPTAAEIAAGQMANGRKIVETEADIAELNAGNIRAQSAVVAEIFTTALTAEKISASEAFMASATVPELYVTAIQAIGDSLDLSANESIKLIVGNVKIGGRNYLPYSKDMIAPDYYGFVDYNQEPVVDAFIVDEAYAG